MTNDVMTPEVRGRLEAKVEALEWALGLRHEFQMATAVTPTKRGMPSEIKTRILQEVNKMKRELGLPIDRFPTIRGKKCPDCGHYLWFDRMTDLLCTRCGKVEQAAA